jgi:hypothetical protein
MLNSAREAEWRRCRPRLFVTRAPTWCTSFDPGSERSTYTESPTAALIHGGLGQGVSGWQPSLRSPIGGIRNTSAVLVSRKGRPSSGPRRRATTGDRWNQVSVLAAHGPMRAEVPSTAEYPDWREVVAVSVAREASAVLLARPHLMVRRMATTGREVGGGQRQGEPCRNAVHVWPRPSDFKPGRERP